MNPAKLKHLVAVDRFGSFTAAAKAVHITQSALTKSVAEIEGEVGFALFDRHARGVAATAQGRVFIARAARIVADFDQLLADSRAGRELYDSRIRIGVCPPSLVSLMNTSLVKMLARHPSVCIEQTAGWVEESLQHLKNRDIDLLVGPAPALEQAGQFIVHPLSAFEICFFVRNGHPLTQKTRPQLADLSEYPMALADKSVATPELTRQLFNAEEIPAEKQLHIIGNFTGACKIVEATDTVGTVGASYRHNPQFTQSFTILDIEALAPIPLAIACDAKWLPSPPMATLVELLQAEPHWSASS